MSKKKQVLIISPCYLPAHRNSELRSSACAPKLEHTKELDQNRTGSLAVLLPWRSRKKSRRAALERRTAHKRTKPGMFSFLRCVFFLCVREFNELTKPKCCLWIMLAAKRIIRRKALWMYWGKRDGIYFRPIGVFFWTCQFSWIAINWIRFKLGELM